jgi:UDP-4-amino-4-deoxy-L-arabinose-oxoglutarate aminotransferase
MQVPFYKHQLNAGDAAKIADVLAGPMLTSGNTGRAVEAEIAAYFGVPHALLTNSWSNGALATLLALDLAPGDEVIVPAMTFIATANVVELLGGRSVFADVDSATLLMTPESAAAVATAKTRAIIPVHLYGQMVDIAALRAQFGPKIKIIEDCAHCFEGTLVGDRPGTHSDAAIFSFYATKNITCGEGGAIITRDDELAEKLKATRLHGMSAGAADRFKAGAYNHWDMLRLGVKANLPDLLAALLPDQIKAAAKKLERREALAGRYESAFADDARIRLQAPVGDATHARHLFPICVAPEIRDQLIQALNAEGVGCTVNYRSVPMLSYYAETYRHKPDHHPVSDLWGRGTLSLPLYPTLEPKLQTHVIETVLRALDALGSKTAKGRTRDATQQLGI